MYKKARITSQYIVRIRKKQKEIWEKSDDSHPFLKLQIRKLGSVFLKNFK